MLDIAFLASNNGSAMRAIVAAIEDGRLSARAVLVVSNRASAAALDFAAAHSIPSLHIATTPDPVAADVALRSALETCGAGLVVMSGYLRKLGPQTLQALPGRILNVHPSLLPDFGGDGMYGRRVHEAVLASGAGVSGATIHVRFWSRMMPSRSKPGSWPPSANCLSRPLSPLPKAASALSDRRQAARVMTMLRPPALAA